MANLAEILNNVVSDSGTSIASLQPLLTNPVTGTGTTNYIPKWSGTTAIGASQIFDNGTSVGIGTATPGASFTLDVNGNFLIRGGANTIGSTSAVNVLDMIGSGALGSATRYRDNITFRGAVGSETWVQGSSLTGFSIYAYSGNPLYFYTGGSKRMTITDAGRVLIGTTTESTYELDVNGTARVSGNFTALNNSTVTSYTETYLHTLGSSSTFDANVKFGNYGNNSSFAPLWLKFTGSGRNYTDDIRFTFEANDLSATTLSVLYNNFKKSTGAAISSTKALVRYANNGTDYFSFMGGGDFYVHSGSVGIGTTSPNASALVDIVSTTKGFLPPRMTSTQRAAISTPAVGLVVYQTDATEGTYEYTSAGWRVINGGGSSAYSVNSVTTTYTETATSGTKIVKADTTGGAFTINLPAAVSNTATIIIKKTAGSGALTVDGNSTETIDGGLTAVINKIGESITLISDNSNWQIV